VAPAQQRRAGTVLALLPLLLAQLARVDLACALCVVAAPSARRVSAWTMALPAAHDAHAQAAALHPRDRRLGVPLAQHRSGAASMSQERKLQLPRESDKRVRFCSLTNYSL